MRDLHNNIAVDLVLAPIVIDADATTAGAVVDRQGFESLEFALATGELADGAFALALAHSDTVDEDGDLVGEAAVGASDIIGALPELDESGAVGKVGYRGSKRYVRADIVSTTTTDGGPISAIAIKGNPRNAPVE